MTSFIDNIGNNDDRSASRPRPSKESQQSQQKSSHHARRRKQSYQHQHQHQHQYRYEHQPNNKNYRNHRRFRSKLISSFSILAIFTIVFILIVNHDPLIIMSPPPPQSLSSSLLSAQISFNNNDTPLVLLDEGNIRQRYESESVTMYHWRMIMEKRYHHRHYRRRNKDDDELIRDERYTDINDSKNYVNNNRIIGSNSGSTSNLRMMENLFRTHEIRPLHNNNSNHRYHPYQIKNQQHIRREGEGINNNNYNTKNSAIILHKIDDELITVAGHHRNHQIDPPSSLSSSSAVLSNIPLIAWLTAYPIAGGSEITLSLLRDGTNSTVATNRGDDPNYLKGKASIPLGGSRKRSVGGPFLDTGPNHTANIIPPKFMLTKTQCRIDASCYNCSYTRFVSSCDDFLAACLKGKRGFVKKQMDNNGGLGLTKKSMTEMIWRDVGYDFSLVKRIVHVVRNPLDNIVSRFHNIHESKIYSGVDQTWLETYPLSVKGFHKWCHNIDLHSKRRGFFQTEAVIRGASELLASPCGTEIFQYVQWHNHVLQIGKMHNIPMLILQYDQLWYNSRGVLDDIFDFLEMNNNNNNNDLVISTLIEGNNNPNHHNGYYDNIYFGKIQRMNFAKAVQKISSKETWHYLRTFFQDEIKLKPEIFLRRDEIRYFDDAESEGSIDQRPFPYSDMPSIAWIMAYPNCGAPQIIHLMREVGDVMTGTNYGLDIALRNKVPFPLYGPDNEDGPFIEAPSSSKNNEVSSSVFVLTKTHCHPDSYCYNCKHTEFIMDPKKFISGCLGGNVVMLDNSRGDGSVLINVNKTLDLYGINLVRRAVHIVRNPLDVLVERFHHKRSEVIQGDDLAKSKKWLKKHPPSVIGFHRWCNNIDLENRKQRWLQSNIIKDVDAKSLLVNTLCSTELFRYVQWHNNAFQITDGYMMPTLVVHFEDFEDRYDSVVKDFLSFLKLSTMKEVNPSKEFDKSKNNYFTTIQKRNVAKVVERLSTTETWNHLVRYFK